MEKLSFKMDRWTDRQTETQVHLLSCAFTAKNVTKKNSEHDNFKKL